MSKLVLPGYILAPRPAPEPFPLGRADLYYWLASWVLKTEDYRFASSPRTRCISAEQMIHPRQEDILELLPVPERRGDNIDLEIVDIANNLYHPLSDMFLYHVARAVHEHVSTDPNRRIVILLPLLPADGSIFWHSMPETEVLSDGSHRTMVLANDGRSWPSGCLVAPDIDEYRAMVASPEPDLKAMLKARTVTQIGHHDLGATDGPRCATHFFDTEAAEYEMCELAIRWARRNHFTGQRFTLISYGRRGAAGRFHRAISGAAATLGCGFRSVSANSPVLSTQGIEGSVVLIFNVIDSGLAFRRVVHSLQEQAIPLAPKALTILKTNPKTKFGRRYPALEVLCESFQREAVPRKDCHQCRLGLAHTPRSNDRYLPVRAIDIWQILLECEWDQEMFGPVGREFLRYAPNMAQVFERYGDWFAYKIGELLRSLGIERDIVFVCPEEPHIERLIERLGIIMQNRQVSILVPRSIINSPDLTHDLLKYQADDWHIQLSYLRGKNANIVLIDEFSRSFTTAKDIIRLIEHEQLGLRHKAYIPILDLAPNEIRRPPLTYPLYRLPYVGTDSDHVQEEESTSA